MDGSGVEVRTIGSACAEIAKIGPSSARLGRVYFAPDPLGQGGFPRREATFRPTGASKFGNLNFEFPLSDGLPTPRIGRLGIAGAEISAGQSEQSGPMDGQGTSHRPTRRA